MRACRNPQRERGLRRERERDRRSALRSGRRLHRRRGRDGSECCRRGTGIVGKIEVCNPGARVSVHRYYSDGAGEVGQHSRTAHFLRVDDDLDRWGAPVGGEPVQRCFGIIVDPVDAVDVDAGKRGRPRHVDTAVQENGCRCAPRARALRIGFPLLLVRNHGRQVNDHVRADRVNSIRRRLEWHGGGAAGQQQPGRAGGEAGEDGGGSACVPGAGDAGGSGSHPFQATV
jgi:hypothetical protein